MTDALDHLAHDHADLNRRVLALRAQLRTLQRARGEPAQLEATLVELREQLFRHFSREEEGLFPFVAEHVPELAAKVNEMSIAHDTICGALGRMVHFAATDASLAAVVAIFERFETAYAEHARAEGELFTTLQERLDLAQRERLAVLVEGL